MNALEMKLIAMKFALARREYLPNDKKFTSTSGAYDIGSIQQQLGQGITIDDRDLTITNTIIEDCDHAANAEPVTQSTESTPEPQVVATPTEPETTPEPVTPVPPQAAVPEPVTTTPPVQVIPDPVVQPDANQSFGGRIWQYFKDTTNVQPKP
jgi:hypothetical protein